MKYGCGTGSFTAVPTIPWFTANRHDSPSNRLTGVDLNRYDFFFLFSAFLATRRQPAGDVGAARTPLQWRALT
jgi:hypothetical protein